jgi:hypothetical protein
MRLPARIADTARCAETSFGPISNGFEIIVVIPLLGSVIESLLSASSGHFNIYMLSILIPFLV